MLSWSLPEEVHGMAEPEVEAAWRAEFKRIGEASRIETLTYIPIMPVLPFSSDVEVAKFARAFLDGQVERFNKDIKICLTRDAKNSHAYFPALITCIAFADFLSGLYAGKLHGHGLKELKDYASNFMTADYTQDRLDVLYECFRQKVAHLALPYAVFDTNSKPKTFRGQPKRLITWTVEAGRRKPAVEIVEQKSAKQILRAITPWPVHYDHRAIVRLRNLAYDIKQSIPKYLCRLEADKSARDNFKKCMVIYFPR
jgi:hypothetical protein